MKKPVVKVEFGEDFSKDSRNKSRRRFIKLGGLAFAGSSFLMYSCSDDDLFDPNAPISNPPPEPEPEPEPDPDPDPEAEVFDLGAGNLGILNYAYALEQLEADFYTKVQAGAYFAGASEDEKQILTDVWYHEVIHRDFFKAAINTAVGEGNEAMVLPELEFDFESVNFDDRTSVLETALLLEDTGVAAYNGAGKLIDVDAEMGGTYLLLAGKIVSVEARHAAVFADLTSESPTAFARDEVLVSLTLEEESYGPAFDKALMPSEILAAAGGFITTEFTATQLPTE